jgi:C1A family cysteine protease
MNRLVLACALVALTAAVPVFKVGSFSFTSEEDALFQRFKSEHGKVYFDANDETYRKSVFTANLKKIRAHEEKGLSYTLGMNEFGDMTWEEFYAKHTGFLGVRGRFMRSNNYGDLSEVSPAASVDWTEKGAVTPVKNQGQCGSCWSFSSTGSIEGATYIATNTLTSLSEQQLMDCSKSEGNMGCNGGLMDYAFEYVIKNNGICSESSYPYKEEDGTCQSCTPVATISSYKDVQESESALETAVTQQPVSIAIEADQEAFQFYNGGVMTGTCGTELDHGVLAVGYGTYSGTDYWKVKNSWGPSWGLEGYILLEKGKSQSGGQCGILMSASYPVV